LDAVQWSRVGGNNYSFSPTVVQTPEGTYTLYTSNDSLARTNAYALGGILTVAGAIQGAAAPASNPEALPQAQIISDSAQQVGSVRELQPIVVKADAS
jgi:hypothetical protein